MDFHCMGTIKNLTQNKKPPFIYLDGRLRRHPHGSVYPKPYKQQTTGLPMLRIVIPNSSPYPKPFKLKSMI